MNGSYADAVSNSGSRPCPAGGDFSPKPTLSGRCPR